MKLKYPFSQEVRLLFFDAQYCWKCGRNANAGIELHHIFGRVSNSAFNCAPLCLECHRHVKHNREERWFLVKTTFIHLQRINHIIVPEDLRFADIMEKYFIPK